MYITRNLTNTVFCSKNELKAIKYTRCPEHEYLYDKLHKVYFTNIFTGVCDNLADILCQDY